MDFLRGILLIISADLRLFQVLVNAEDNLLNRLIPLKTRDIPTLTSPHLHLSNNGCNPPSPPEFSWRFLRLKLMDFQDDPFPQAVLP